MFMKQNNIFVYGKIIKILLDMLDNNNSWLGFSVKYINYFL